MTTHDVSTALMRTHMPCYGRRLCCGHAQISRVSEFFGGLTAEGTHLASRCTHLYGKVFVGNTTPCQSGQGALF